jgi:hypothetical protein
MASVLLMLDGSERICDDRLTVTSAARADAAEGETTCP